MATRKPAKGKKHTSPKRAGAKNIKSTESLPKDNEMFNEQILTARLMGKENNQLYKGLWTDEQLEKSIDDFFAYCTKEGLKPTQPLIQLWLGITRQTYWEWKTKPEKYGYKSYLIEQATMFMESYLQANADKYPTASLFLLRTTHGHVETNKLDVTANHTLDASDDVRDLISKLGLDK
jgi:hypothetical protein